MNSREQIFQQRMTDRASGELDHVVRAPTPETESISPSCESQRRAVGPRQHRHSNLDDRIQQLAGPRQRLGHDGRLQDQLGTVRDVLPGTSSAPCSMGGAGRHDAMHGRLEHIEHLASDEVLLRLHDVDLDQFARERAANEGNAAVLDPSDGVAAGCHLLGTHHDR